MLDKKYRLPSSSFLTKYTISTPLFTLKVGDNLGIKRFGFVVSKKIDKRAVARNYIKRIFRASVQNLVSEVGTGKDFLFIVKKNAVGQSQQKIEGEIKNTLTKYFK